MTSPHHDHAAELRVLHWNIHSWRDEDGGSNLESVVNLVRATDPQVVSLVEVDEPWGEASALDEVANRCGYFSIFVPAFEFGAEAPAGGFGNALLSKLPILAVRQRQLVWPTRQFDGSEPSEPRSVVFAKVQTATGQVWIGSTHLPRAEADTRAKAVEQLMGIAQQLREPWLLLGDFNMPGAGWIEPYPSLTVSPVNAQPTHPSNDPIEPIDYCVAPKELTVQVEVLDTTGSDHLPVLVNFAV